MSLWRVDEGGRSAPHRSTRLRQVRGVVHCHRISLAGRSSHAAVVLAVVPECRPVGHASDSPHSASAHVGALVLVGARRVWGVSPQPCWPRSLHVTRIVSRLGKMHHVARSLVPGPLRHLLPKTLKRVVVVGGGPTGLFCADRLRLGMGGGVDRNVAERLSEAVACALHAWFRIGLVAAFAITSQTHCCLDPFEELVLMSRCRRCPTLT